MSSPILHQNPTKTITLIDIPLSLEYAQGHPSPGKLLSSQPLQTPYPSLKPKSEKARAKLPKVSLDELLLVRHLELALDEVRQVFSGKWCLNRAVEEPNGGEKRKRKLEGDEETIDVLLPHGEELSDTGATEEPVFFHNTSDTRTGITIKPSLQEFSVPPKATVLQGSIENTIEMFTTEAPVFDLVILDPPWPNRSARRKGSYTTSWGNDEIRDLLESIPLQDHLEQEAFVGVWVTNKSAFREMLVGEGGLFRKWGVSVIEEWIWVKVTEEGEPICDLDSTWRKPYEVLLIGKKTVDGEEQRAEKPTRRVIISVPDVHSRKPNLRLLFDAIMGKKGGEYKALEIFARNLTSSWWSWGNEVLKFQSQDHWIQP